MSKGIAIDIDAIIDQLERPDLAGSRVCFDRQEYEVVVVSKDVLQGVADSDIEQIASLSEWKKDLVETAENILFYEKERYLDLPDSLISMTKHLMAEFINSLPSGQLKNELNVVVEYDNPIEIYEKVLFEHPEEKERWAEFSDTNLREAIVAWLKTQNFGKPGEGT